MSFLAHQAAYRTTRWAAWRIKNRKQLSAQRDMRTYERMSDAEKYEATYRYITQDRSKK